jgi:hypothetical protein
MYVNEWMNYECSNQGTYRVHTQNIHNSSTRPYASEDRTGNRSTKMASVNGPEGRQVSIYIDELGMINGRFIEFQESSI